MKLVKNPAYTKIEQIDGAVGDGSAPYICPISGLEMTGKFRFIFLWSCGCVLAERALKEVKQNLCHMVSITVLFLGAYWNQFFYCNLVTLKYLIRNVWIAYGILKLHLFHFNATLLTTN